MKDRLSKIITTEGLTPSLLADEMGIQRSGISHILSGRNQPSFDFLRKLLIRFPKLNANWLISGEGPMYLSTDTVTSDLFASSNVAEKTRETSDITPKPQNLSPREGDKNTLPDRTLDPSPPERIKKTIEAIITFYTDKTFTAYSPE